MIARLKQFPPENAAKECDIPLETIKDLARKFAEGPSTIAGGYGQDHWTNGQYSYQAMYTLLMVTGNMGKPGTGLSGAVSWSFGFGPSTAPMDNPVGHLSSAPSVPVLLMPEVVETGKYGDVSITPKSLFLSTINLLSNVTDRQSYVEMFDKLDFVVVAETRMSETASYADILLPAAYWFEVDTVTALCTLFVNISEKAIEPLYESKGDFEIINLLAEGMGLGPEFPLTSEEYFTGAFENDTCKQLGLSYERLKKEKQLLGLGTTADYICGASGVYPTETGRAQFYLETVVPTFQFGQTVDLDKSKLPYWEPPLEAWHENELFKKYPLIFTTERPRFRVHTQFSESQWLKELEPEPFIRINPQDAAAREIKNGDMVKVFNDRGFIVVKAVIHNGIRPGMLVIPHGWQEKDFIDGHYSDLASRKTNLDIVNHAYFDVLCEVVKM